MLIGYLFLILQIYLLAYRPKQVESLFKIDYLHFLFGIFGCTILIGFKCFDRAILEVIVFSVMWIINLKGIL